MGRFTFNTIGIFTTDNRKVVDFYCNIFGFETEWRSAHGDALLAKNGTDIDVEMHLDPSKNAG